MRKKIVFLLAFLCMLLLAGGSNGKETSKYNIEYLNNNDRCVDRRIFCSLKF